MKTLIDTIMLTESKFDIDYNSIVKVLEKIESISNIRTVDDRADRKILSKKYRGIDFKYNGVPHSILGVQNPFSLETVYIVTNSSKEVLVPSSELNSLENSIKKIN